MQPVSGSRCEYIICSFSRSLFGLSKGELEFKQRDFTERTMFYPYWLMCVFYAGCVSVCVVIPLLIINEGSVHEMKLKKLSVLGSSLFQ